MWKGVSYAAVAKHADNNGRRKLAAMLVDQEPRSSKQVYAWEDLLMVLNLVKYKELVILSGKLNTLTD